MLSPTFPYWVLPTIAAGAWALTLAILLGNWIFNGRPHLRKMQPTQTIAYISDSGAEGATKYVFVVGTFVSGGAFVATSIILARWVVLWIRDVESEYPEFLTLSLTVVAAALATLGAGGAVLLAFYDKIKYKTKHHAFLGVFMLSSTSAAILIIVVSSLLDFADINEPLKVSYYLKISFTGAGFVTGAVFISTTNKKLHKRNTAAVAEWLTALLFVLYMSTFVLDMLAFPRPEEEDPEYA